MAQQQQRRSISPDLKAQALGMLLTGNTTAYVADALGIPEGTVKSWKSRDANDVATVATETKEELGELVTEYVRESLRTLRIQTQQFADRAWLQKQNAHDAGVLHGIIADKTIRVIQAIHDDD